VAEEDNYVAVENIAARVKSETRIRTEISSVRPDGWRQGQIDSAPDSAAVAGIIAAHGQPKDFIRTGGEVSRIRWVKGNVSLTLRPALIRDVHIVTESN